MLLEAVQLVHSMIKNQCDGICMKTEVIMQIYGHFIHQVMQEQVFQYLILDNETLSEYDLIEQTQYIV